MEMKNRIAVSNALPTPEILDHLMWLGSKKYSCYTLLALLAVILQVKGNTHLHYSRSFHAIHNVNMIFGLLVVTVLSMSVCVFKLSGMLVTSHF